MQENLPFLLHLLHYYGNVSFQPMIAPAHSRLPKPEELRLNFDRWRPVQEAALDVIITSEKRSPALCIPTGGGKTYIALGYAIMSDQPTCIVTASRGLQDQYMRDGASAGLVDIRGRANYQCNMRPDFNCEEGHAARCIYKGTVSCPSSQAEMRAATSKLVVTNYAKWCAAKKYGQGMQHFTQVIFDEGHAAPQALADAMQVILNFREIEDKLKISFPRYPDAEDFAKWKAWAGPAKMVANDAMLAAQARIQGVSNPKPSHVKHFTHMRNLVRRLSVLMTAGAKDWVVEEIPQGFQFDPIRPGKYAEGALLMRMPKVVFISATLRPKTLYMVGISKEKSDFHEFDSDFDPKRGPLYYIPTMYMDSRNPDTRPMWMLWDRIASRRRDRKGITHTISYARRDEVYNLGRYADSLIINPKGEPPTETIDMFKDSGPGSILVSPTVGTGYDFKDDSCRWSFICKLPFEPPSKVQKAREADDREYRAYRTMQTFVQIVGRDVRSREDWSERFIGDKHFEWFIRKHAHLAPRSFHMFCKTIQTLPAPPPLEGPK